MLPAGTAARADPGGGEHRGGVLALVGEVVMLDLALHLDRAVLGRAGRQLELDDADALVLGRQERGRQAQEQHHQQRDDPGIDQ